MTELLADLDWQTLDIIALCLVLGFVIVWTVLSAGSAYRSGKSRPAGEPSVSAKEKDES